ncbi:hypothetical protein VTO73DRAFT_9785 [Trametes versicolor]
MTVNTHYDVSRWGDDGGDLENHRIREARAVASKYRGMSAPTRSGTDERSGASTVCVPCSVRGICSCCDRSDYDRELSASATDQNPKPETREVRDEEERSTDASGGPRRARGGVSREYGTHEPKKRLAGDARVAIMRPRPPTETWMTAVGGVDIARGVFVLELGMMARRSACESSPPRAPLRPGFCTSWTDAVAPGSAVRA